MKSREKDRQSEWAGALSRGALDVAGMEELAALYRELAAGLRQPLPLEGKVKAHAPAEAKGRLTEGFVLVDPAVLRPRGGDLEKRVAEAARVFARHSEEEKGQAAAKVAAAARGEALDRFARAYLDRGDEGLRAELAAGGLDPEVGSFLLFNALKGAFLPLGDLYRDADLSPWKQPHCPVCGGAPALGTMEGEGGRRHLVCHRCETRWAWRRIVCPFCGNDDPHLLLYLSLKGPEEGGEKAPDEAPPALQPQEVPGPPVRLDACDACHAYLKVRDQRGSAAPFPEVEDLFTALSDLAACQQGYHRGAPNIFGVRVSREG